MIDRISDFYEHENSNIHRAAHALAARSTDAYEAAREKVRRFLNAPSARDIIFVRGATEGINLVAQSWGRANVREGDEIVVSHLEHHANIVPWQMLCAETGARLRVAPVDDDGQIILEEYEKLLGPRTRIVAITQVSNALGTVTPVREMTAMAHRHGACVLIDGAQSVSHMPVDVQAIDCDFFVFSGHKVFGPTGIGAVYGKRGGAGKNAAMAGRRQHDRRRHLREDDVSSRRRSVSRRAPAISPTPSASARPSTMSSRSAWRTSRAYEHELLVYATEKMLGRARPDA